MVTSSWDVKPGQGLGFLSLGDDLSRLFECIQTQLEAAKMELKYDEANWTAHDWALNLPLAGICGRLDPETQKLKSLEVYNLKDAALSFRGTDISSPATVSTFDLVYSTFGPTVPGQLDKNGHYILSYPGAAFLFNVPTEHQTYVRQLGDHLPFIFPDGTAPVLARVQVFHGSSWKEATVLNESQIITLNSGKGLQVGEATLHFGSSCQVVLSLLGHPSHKFLQNASKMQVGGSSSQEKGQGSPDYWWSYASRGLDILFDYQRHNVKKFVFHTNAPGHPDFNRYAKAQFRISNSGKSFLLNDVTPDTTWDAIQKKLGPPDGPPVVHKPPLLNPFDPTRFFGYSRHGLIFQILKNGHIVSVIAYPLQHNK